MKEASYRPLARLLTGHSTRLRRGERVWIDAAEIPEDFVIELIRAVRERGAEPYVQLHGGRVSRELARGATEAGLKFSLRHDLARLKSMQAYIGLRGAQNTFESSDVPLPQQKMIGKILRPFSDRRINHTRWVVLRWPSPSMAQAAGMSTEAFEEIFFQVCTLDYRKMAGALQPLVRRMRRTDRVHIMM